MSQYIWGIADIIVPEMDILGLYSNYYQEDGSHDRLKCVYSDFVHLSAII